MASLTSDAGPGRPRKKISQHRGTWSRAIKPRRRAVGRHAKELDHRNSFVEFHFVNYLTKRVNSVEITPIQCVLRR
jgi:hypothetical protein